MTEMARARLTISGRVQGVFYRQSTRDKARSLRLSGWVRNLYDGTVEVEAIGPRERVEDLIAWCRQGPPSASVSDVQVEWMESAEEDIPSSAHFVIK